MENGKMFLPRKRICAAAAAFALLLTSANGLFTAQQVCAAQTEWKFDFGGNGAANGYTAVSAANGYNAGAGYGFANPGGVKNVAAAGKNELSDAVQFTSNNKGHTFNVDLPNGLYRMTIHTGNIARSTVWAEGYQQIINMTGNNAVDTIQIPVTDGQLNVMMAEGKAGTAFSLSAMELTLLSNDPTMKQTIWLCGDSTVCNYYPLETRTESGWGRCCRSMWTPRCLRCAT